METPAKPRRTPARRSAEKAKEKAFSGARGWRLRGRPQTACKRRRRRVLAGRCWPAGSFSCWGQPGSRPGRDTAIVTVVNHRRRLRDLAAQQRGGMGPGGRRVGRFGMGLGKRIGRCQECMRLGMRSHRHDAFSAAVVVVPVPRRAELVEHQQQQHQPAQQPRPHGKCRRRRQPARGQGGAHAETKVRTGRLDHSPRAQARRGRLKPEPPEPPQNPQPRHCAPLIRTLSSLTELTKTSTSGPRWMNAASMGPIHPINAAVMPSTCTTPTPTNRFSCTVR